jgi:ribosomal protein S18 acetylase RimI-like enzyme
MQKEIRKIDILEIDKVSEILNSVVGHMKKIGFTQWNDEYPTRDILLNDIKNRELYGAYIDDTLAGFVVLNDHQEPEYQKVEFEYEEPCLVVHRLQVDPSYRGKNIGYDLMKFAEENAKKAGCKSIRLDTREDNMPAIGLYTKLGYKKRGHVHFPHMMEYEFPCFEKSVVE